MNEGRIDLLCAFPVIVREDARVVLSKFPDSEHFPALSFSVRIGNEIVSPPYRIYNDPAAVDAARLSDLQRELADCLLTMHNDGFVCEQHLVRIIHSKSVWVAPFVVHRVGECVIEILQVAKLNLQNLDTSIYGRFLRANPEFLATTERRVISYWNRYYRDCKREEYVGFRVAGFS
jgi:hypothetical protein